MKALDKYILEKFQITKDSKVYIDVDIDKHSAFTSQEVDEINELVYKLPVHIICVTNNVNKLPLKDDYMMDGYLIANTQLHIHFDVDSAIMIYIDSADKKLKNEYASKQILIRIAKEPNMCYNVKAYINDKQEPIEWSKTIKYIFDEYINEFIKKITK